MTVALIDRLGRKKTQALLFFGCTLSIGALLLPVYESQMIALGLAFLARAFIMGTFSSVYVYTPEVYPTFVRTTGTGTAASIAKIASVLTPFVSNVLIDVNLAVPIAIYAVFCLAAAAASLLLPIETGSRAMVESFDDFEKPKRKTVEPNDVDERHDMVALLSDDDDNEGSRPSYGSTHPTVGLEG
jgi:MFS family permease